MKKRYYKYQKIKLVSIIMAPARNEMMNTRTNQTGDVVKLLLIGIFAVISLLVTLYAVTENGDGTILENYYLIPHLYIIPIILVSLWYPQRGMQVILLLIGSIAALTGFIFVIRHTVDPILSLMNAGVDVWIVAALALSVRSRVAPQVMPKPAGTSEIIEKSPPRLIDGYIEALNLDDEGVRHEAVRALAVDDPRALRALVKALDDESRVVREEAIRSLGKLSRTDAIPPLLEVLKDENRVMRETAVKALGGKGDTAVEPLIEALTDSDWHVRMGAAIALRIIGDPRSVDPLIQRLADENRFVRREVVKSLGRFGDERAQERLLQLREDPDQTVRLRAETALMKIHGRIFEREATNISTDKYEIE